jgi:hypothetical protein
MLVMRGMGCTTVRTMGRTPPSGSSRHGRTRSHDEKDREALVWVALRARRLDVSLIRPGYVYGREQVHHFVEVDVDEDHERDDQPLKALCGAYVDSVDAGRPLWKAGGEPCSHCSKIFRDRGLCGPR